MRKELKQVSPNALATEANYYADPSQTMGEGEAYADVSMDTQGEDVPPGKNPILTQPESIWEWRKKQPPVGYSESSGLKYIPADGPKPIVVDGAGSKGSSSNGSSSSSKSKAKQQQKPKKPMDAGKAPQEGQEYQEGELDREEYGGKYDGPSWTTHRDVFGDDNYKGHLPEFNVGESLRKDPHVGLQGYDRVPTQTELQRKYEEDSKAKLEELDAQIAELTKEIDKWESYEPVLGASPLTGGMKQDKESKLAELHESLDNAKMHRNYIANGGNLDLIERAVNNMMSKIKLPDNITTYDQMSGYVYTLPDLGWRGTIEGSTYNLLEDTQKILQAFKDNQDGTFVGGVLRGVRDRVFDFDTWSQGISEFVDDTYRSKVFDKIEKGEELTKQEQAFMDALSANLLVNAMIGGDLGRGYDAGLVTGYSFAFMAEMYLNPLSRMGTKAAQKTAGAMLRYYGRRRILENGALRYMEHGLVKAEENILRQQGLRYIAGSATRKAITKAAVVASRNAGHFFGAGAMALTSGAFRTTASVMERMNGRQARAGVLDQDENGEYVIRNQGAGYKLQENLYDALFHGVSEIAIEDWSEMMGLEFTPLLRSAKQYVRPLMKSMCPQLLSMYERFAGSQFSQTMMQLGNRAHYNGFWEEFAEEIVGGIANSLVVGDQTLDAKDQTGVFNRENLIRTALGVAVIPFVSGSINLSVNYGGEQYKQYKMMRSAEEGGSMIFGDRWDNLMGRINNTNTSDMPQLVDQILDSCDTQEERSAALNYIINVMKMRGLEECAEMQGIKRTYKAVTMTMYESQRIGREATEEERTEIIRRREEAVARVRQELGINEDEDVGEFIASLGDTPDEVIATLFQTEAIPYSATAGLTDERFEGYSNVELKRRAQMAMDRYSGAEESVKQQIEEEVDAIRQELYEREMMSYNRSVALQQELNGNTALQAVLDYYNYSAAYKGTLEAEKYDAEQAVQRNNDLVDEVTNKDGQVVVAKTKSGNEVNVTGGNLQLKDDGSVDVENSDATVVVRSVNENGVTETKMIATEMISEVSSTEDAKQRKEREAEAIRAEEERKRQWRESGRVDFQVGQTYSGQNASGFQYQVTVIGQNEDGTLVVEWVGTGQQMVVGQDELRRINQDVVRSQRAEVNAAMAAEQDERVKEGQKQYYEVGEDIDVDENFELQVASVSRVDYETGTPTYVVNFVKKEDGSIARQQEMTADQINNLLRSTEQHKGALRRGEVVEANTGVDERMVDAAVDIVDVQPGSTYNARSTDGRNYSVTIGEQNEDGTYNVKMVGDNRTFTVSEEEVQRIKRDVARNVVVNQTRRQEKEQAEAEEAARQSAPVQRANVEAGQEIALPDAAGSLVVEGEAGAKNSEMMYNVSLRDDQGQNVSTGVMSASQLQEMMPVEEEVPADEEGNPRWTEGSVNATVQALDNDEDFDNDEERAAFAQMNYEEAKAEVERLQNNPPKMSTNLKEFKEAKQQYKAALAEAQGRQNHWEEVAAVYTGRAGKKLPHASKSRVAGMIAPSSRQVTSSILGALDPNATEEQKQLYDRAKQWHDNLGVNIITNREQMPNTEGAAWRAMNLGQSVPGWYNVETGQAFVYLPDVRDIRDLEETIWHEVVSHKGLRELMGKQEYAKFCDKIWNQLNEEEQKRYMNYHLYGRMSSDIDDATFMIFSSRPDLRRAAADEMMAHVYAERMWNDSLLQRILDVIREFISKIKSAFGLSNKVSDAEIRNLLRNSYYNMSANNEDLNVLPEAEHPSSINEAVLADPHAVDIGEQVMFNRRSEDDLRRAIMKYATTSEAKGLGWTEQNVEEMLEETTALLNALDAMLTGDTNYNEFRDKAPTMRVDWRDGIEKPIVTWSRNNIEYKYDMSADTFCINNEGIESILASPTMADLMMNMYDNSGFTSDDYLMLYETLRDMGFVVPCKGCFDAAARFKMLPSVAQKFAELVNQVVDERNADPEAFDERARNIKAKNYTVTGLPGSASNKKDAVTIGVAGDKLTEHIKWTDLMSAEGQTEALSTYGGVFRAWQKTGAGRPKDKLKPEPYIGDIVSSYTTIIAPYGETIPSYRALSVNVGTGLRRNSHSEFRPVLVVDEMQFIRDAWLKNLCVFKYMKELDDVRLFGNMGVKYNMSGFPAWDANGTAAGLDENGEYLMAEESVGGREFPYTAEDGTTHYDGAKGLEEAKKYINKDVSLSSVVMSMPHFVKCLTDVPTPNDKSGTWGSLIPFHASGATAHSLKVQGLGSVLGLQPGSFMNQAFGDWTKGVTNFEDVQNDRYGRGYEVVFGGKAGSDAHGLKMFHPDAKVLENKERGVMLYLSPSAYENYGGDMKVITEKVKDKKGKVKTKKTVSGMFYTLESEGHKIAHPLAIDYNDKVRELGTEYAYKEAADFYRDELRSIGLLPRFDFDVPEEEFLRACADAKVDPYHPKLGWKGDGNSWSPADAESYYSVWCDYGMTDPETGYLSQHRPVLDGSTDPKAFENALPADFKEIIAEGLARYSGRRADEMKKESAAIAEFCHRGIEKGKISEEDVRSILESNGFSNEDIQHAIYGSDYGQEESGTQFRRREKPAPKEVKTAYKLMRLKDGKLYPLFIGNDEEIEVGTWYDAESPNLSVLKTLPAGYHLLNLETGEATSWIEYAEKNVPKNKKGKMTRSKPNREDVEWANANGMRFMHIVDKSEGKSAAKMERQYGDARAYYNGGINGSKKDEEGKGSASDYALRPGWHFGATCSMRQIGYGNDETGEKDVRLDNQVWVEVEMAADVDYQDEANNNPEGDIPDHIPTDGYYTYATNPVSKKGKNEESNKSKADWYVAGAFKPVRILSDSEADNLVRQYNEDHGTNVPLDYRREGGRVFNAETMALEDGVRFSRSNPEEYRLGEKESNSGGKFYERNGSYNLVNIPIEVCESIGIKNVSLRVNEAMANHILTRHGNEIGAKTNEDAVAFIVDVMTQFDHVREGADKGSYIFSIENGRTKTGRRAITIIISNGEEDYLGVRTSGYERIESLKKRPLLWEKGAKETSTTVATTANVTNSMSKESGRTYASASNQSNGYVGKGNNKELSKQGNSKKSAQNNADGAENATQFRRNDVFVSNAARAVEGIKQDKATPQQWLAMITKNGGLKAEEDKWMGLSEWLNGNSAKSITKDDVLQFIAENSIEVQDVEYGETSIPMNDEFQQILDEVEREGNLKTASEIYEEGMNRLAEKYGDDIHIAFGTNEDGELVVLNPEAAEQYGVSGIPINATRLEYTTDGLDYKREIALVVPTIDQYNEDDDIHFGDAGEGRAVAWARFGETTDEEGNRVLVIDEIQSKRHQDGRERGYESDYSKSPRGKFQTAAREMREYRSELSTKYGDNFLVDDLTAEEQIKYKELLTNMKELSNYDSNGSLSYDVPDAPFRKNWHELAMKRMLRLAAEEGCDKIAWTKGQQQAMRYSLGRVVDLMTVNPAYEITDSGEPLKEVTLYMNNGELALYVDKEGNVKDYEGRSPGFSPAGMKLSEIVGKENAEKLLRAEEFTRLDKSMFIGGEGMMGFYDKMLPNFMNKYGKKWGVKVGEVNLPDVEEAGRTMWSVDVTPEMKASVMEGQTMFKRRDGDHWREISTSEVVDYLRDIDNERVGKNITSKEWPMFIYRLTGIARRNTMMDENGRTDDIGRTDVFTGNADSSRAEQYASTDNVDRNSESLSIATGFVQYLSEDLEKVRPYATPAVQAKMDKLMEDYEHDLGLFERLANGEDALADDDFIRFRRDDEKRTLATAGTYFSGGGLVEAGLNGVVDNKFAAEFDEKIAGVYADNYGDHMLFGDVSDITIEDLVAATGDGHVNFFHASPVCKSYSTANVNNGEKSVDISTAEATANAIRNLKPDAISIENVAQYKGSEAYNIIVSALEEMGYNYDANVYNAADFGSHTARKRMILRAVKEGRELPAIPEAMEHKGWGEVISDEDIQGMPIAELPENMQRQLARQGFNWKNVERPTILINQRGNISIAGDDKPAPTIKAKDAGDFVVLPGGDVRRLTIDALAKIMGLPEDYKLPKGITLAHTVIGNGIPVELTKAVIAPLAEQSIRYRREERTSKNKTHVRARRYGESIFDYAEDISTNHAATAASAEARREVIDIKQKYRSSEITTDDISREIVNEKSHLDFYKKSLARARRNGWSTDVPQQYIADSKYKIQALEDLLNGDPSVPGSDWGVSSRRKYNHSDIVDLFKNHNTDERLDKLFDKVSEVADFLGVKYKFATLRDRRRGEEQGGYIRYSTKDFTSPMLTDQEKCQVLLHEMIHGVTTYAIDAVNERGNSVYSAAYGKLPKEVVKAVNDLNDIYSQLRRDGLTRADFYGLENVKEMVAELSNPKFVDELKSHNLFEQIVDGIKRLITGIIRKAEGKSFSKVDAATAVENALDTILQARPKEAFNVVNSAASTLSKNMMAIGEKGYESRQNVQSTVAKAISKAQVAARDEMDKRGMDPKHIKFATGWERGVDGMWRYELGDHDVIFDRNGHRKFAQKYPEDYERFVIASAIVNANDRGTEAYDKALEERNKIWNKHRKEIMDEYLSTLDDYIDHDALFEAYPQLRDAEVMISDELGPQTYGDVYIDHDTGEMFITLNDRLSDAEMKKTLLHEIQHCVQYIEGFGEGGNDENSKRKYLDGLNDEIAAIRMEAVDWYNSLSDEEANAIKSMFERDGHIFNKFRDTFDIYLDTFKPLDEEGRQNLKDAHAEWCAVSDMSSYEFYKAISGEVEARNTENRSEMTDFERRKKTMASTSGYDGKRQFIIRNGKRSYSANETLFEKADRIAKEYDEDVQFRRRDPLEDEYVKGWENLVKSNMFLIREAAVDYLTALTKFQDYIANKNGEKIADNENAYYAMLALTSKSKAEMDIFDRFFMKPLRKSIDKITNGKVKRGSSWETGEGRGLIKYVEAKHGLERNRQMAIESYYNGLVDKAMQTGDPAKIAKAVTKRDNALAMWNTQRKAIMASGMDFATKQQTLDNAAKALHADLSVDYSGLSSVFGVPGATSDWWQEAKDFAAYYEGTKGDEMISELWDAINAINEHNLAKQLSTGLVDRDYVDTQRERYDNYIPLRGYKEDVAHDVYGYLASDNKGLTGKGTPVKKAKGRTSEADNPFAYLLSIGYSTITTGNKNAAKQKLWQFVRNHDTHGLVRLNKAWRIKYSELGNTHGYVMMPNIPAGSTTPVWVEAVPNIPAGATGEEIAQILENFESTMQNIASNGGAVRIGQGDKTKFLTMRPEHQEHTITVYHNGRKETMTIIGNPRLAQAVNGLLNPESDTGAFSDTVQWLRGLMSNAFTGRNLPFAFANIARDSMYANQQAAVKESWTYWAKFTSKQRIAYARWPKMMKLLKKFNDGTLDDSVYEEKLFKEFAMNGGITGYTFMEDQKEYAKALAKQVKDLERKNAVKKVWDVIFDQIEFLGGSSELINRFLIYETSREFGRSVSRSVIDAKEITANFNRKGAGTKTTKSGEYSGIVKAASLISQYGRNGLLFWNANMQSLYRKYENWKHHPVKMTGVELLGTMVLANALPLINDIVLPAIYNMLGDGDDDEYVSYFDDLPSYVRTQNMCFRLPGDAGWVRIPIAPDVKGIYAFGDLLSQMVNGRDIEFKDFAQAFLDYVSPHDINLEFEGWEHIMDVAPTVTLPFLQNFANVDFTGKPIANERVNENAPEWQRVNRSTSTTMIAISRWLNRVSGGTDETKGYIDINPAKAMNLIRGYLGGYATFFIGLSDGFANLISGDNGKMDLKKFFSQAPPFSRFYTSGDQSESEKRMAGQFYKVKEWYESIKYAEGAYKKEIEGKRYYMDKAVAQDELNKLRESGEYSKYKQVEEYVKLVDDLNKYKKEFSDEHSLDGLISAAQRQVVEIYSGRSHDTYRESMSELLDETKNIEDNDEKWGARIKIFKKAAQDTEQKLDELQEKYANAMKAGNTAEAQKIFGEIAKVKVSPEMQLNKAVNSYENGEKQVTRYENSQKKIGLEDDPSVRKVIDMKNEINRKMFALKVKNIYDFKE